MVRIGTVSALYRYPVKSMRGETLTAARLRWQGIDGDRQYAFLRAANRSRFPWLTLREVADLVRYVPRYLDPTTPRTSTLRVTAPDGAEFDIAASALGARLAAAAGEEVRLVQIGRGCFDNMPVSVVSTATAAELDRRYGRALDLRRFRPNIVIDAGETSETAWLGGTLRFGAGPGLRLAQRIERCAIPTIDPDSAERDPAIMRLLVEDFGNEVGVYGATEATGTIAVGDPVYLQRAG